MKCRVCRLVKYVVMYVYAAKEQMTTRHYTKIVIMFLCLKASPAKFARIAVARVNLSSLIYVYIIKMALVACSAISD